MIHHGYSITPVIDKMREVYRIPGMSGWLEGAYKYRHTRLGCASPPSPVLERANAPHILGNICYEKEDYSSTNI